MDMLLFLVTGLAAGVAAGLGVGGGVILIPCLTMFMGMEQRAAQGINLLYFIPTAVVAVIVHIKNKKIDAALVKGLIFYGFAGAAAGAFLAINVEQDFLRRLFGYFLLTIGLYELFGKTENKKIGAE
jgi:hypothetical protein